MVEARLSREIHEGLALVLSTVSPRENTQVPVEVSEREIVRLEFGLLVRPLVVIFAVTW